MTIRAFNSVQGYSVGANPQQDIILANGDITTVNFTANGVSNLGPIGNVKISGGSAGQAIITDGNGNLSFSITATNSAAPMPYYIADGQTFLVPDNFQGLFSQPIEIDGVLEVDGVLIEVNTAFNAESGQIIFDDGGDPTGNIGFTFDKTSGNMNVPGSIISTGDLTPSISNVYSLGNTTHRWSNLWLTGTTIYLGNSVITETSGNLSLTNPDGGELIVTGNTAYSDMSVTGNVNAGTDIIALGTVSGNLLSITGNASVGGIKTDNYYYANGQPLDMQQPAGSNTQVQFNNSNDFGASANFTFNSSTNLLNVTGNIAATNISATGNVSSAYLISTSGCVTLGLGAIAVIGTQAGLFNSVVTDINLGLTSNVVIGSLTGLVTVRNNLTANGTITGDIVSANSVEAGDFYSKRPNVAVTTNTVIDSFDVNTYRSAKYTLKVSDDTGYQALEVLLVHNNINSIITVYGSLSMTGLDLVTLTTAINGSNVELKATSVNANTSVNLMGTYVPD